MRFILSSIFVLFAFSVGTLRASYLQWVSEQASRLPAGIASSLPYEKGETPLPPQCPVPEEKITVVLSRDDGLTLVGGGKDYGVALYEKGKWRYFGGRRWLASDEVKRIVAGDQGDIWVETREGISRLFRRRMTLHEKAQVFLQRLRQRHIKHGFVRFLTLDVPGEPEKGGVLHHADNDGLWTSLYIAAEAFRYAVTRDPAAKQNAWESLQAMMWLQDINPIPGFFARSIVERGEPQRLRYGGEWHVSSDGKWEWKGDTSSDEADGHFFAYALYYELVADEAEKAIIRRYVRQMMDHIIEHDWFLVDLDGEPTTWGKWNPKVFRETVWGQTARGLNSLEVLSFLNTALHLTGDPKYLEAKKSLVKEGYDDYIKKVKVTTNPRFVNHSDDELAAVAYQPFFMFEKDEQLLSAASRGFKRWCKAELPEKSPWFNFLCCRYADDRNLCDVAGAVETLQDIPLDTLNWHVKNSHRADVELDPLPDRHGDQQLAHVLPISERCFLRWNGNPYRPDGCGAGNEEGDGVHFLLPYWMGRYFGLIEE